MLRDRVVTALILAVLVLSGVLGLPSGWFGVALLALVLGCAWEWAGLCGLRGQGRALYLAGVAVVVLGIWPLAGGSAPTVLLMWLAAAYWCAALFWLSRYTRRPERRDGDRIWQAAGVITLVAPWVALLELHARPGFGPGFVVFLLGLIAVADSCAYFAGRRWGRRKLAPRISPGKTWEGVQGAMAGALAFALLGAFLFGFGGGQLVFFVLVCLVTAAFSIVGDLLESMLKRQRAVKDSGRLLPGHGGLLDRVDSLTAAAPIFLLGLQGLHGL